MKKFVFYTYDAKGRDIKVTIWANSQPEAWIKFDSHYGKSTPVDWVKEI